MPRDPLARPYGKRCLAADRALTPPGEGEAPDAPLYFVAVKNSCNAKRWLSIPPLCSDMCGKCWRTARNLTLWVNHQAPRIEKQARKGDKGACLCTIILHLFQVQWGADLRCRRVILWNVSATLRDINPRLERSALARDINTYIPAIHAPNHANPVAIQQKHLNGNAWFNPINLAHNQIPRIYAAQCVQA